MTPVAIVGIGVLFPGAADSRGYWNNLIHGIDAVTDVPPRRWDARFYEPKSIGRLRADQIYCRRGGFVDELATADPARLGMTAKEAAAIDPEQLIALRVAAAAIDDAGGVARLGDLGGVGVVLGRSGYMSPGQVRLDQRVRTARQLTHAVGTMLPSLTAADLEKVRAEFTRRLGPDPADAALGSLPSLTAARIANRLDLTGPAYTIDAACASSLIAVDAAVAELARGRCGAMLAGGVHHCHDVTLWSVFSQLGALSASQRIRPFHAEADGFLLGEGTGVVVLKRLDDALAAGDRIYAVIRGIGMSGDGARVDLAGPDPAGQALAVRRAWAEAGLDPTAPDAVGMIEAHGTGEPAADAAELAALREVFGPATSDNVAVIGSVKSMIGHAMAAAGIAGLIKAALAVYHGVLLPTLNCERPLPALEGTRFRPLFIASPWVSSGPRRAGVSAFGIGGVNAHVVLEQAPESDGVSGPLTKGTPAPATAKVLEPELVLRFAATTPEALIEQLEGDDATTRERGTGVPAYLGPGSRLGLVGPTERRLAVARRVARGARSGGWSAWRGRNDVWLSSEPLLSPAPGRIAFVFPGLEAEYSPQVDDVADHLGLPRPRMSADGIGRHGTGVLRVGRLLELALRKMGIVPDALAGHSIGEWNAMVAAGLFDEAAADEMVFGDVMPDLAAIDVDYASLACSARRALDAIADHPDLVLSHDNSPQQTIVCGPPASIRELAARLRRENVLVQILPFQSGFHTPRLAPYLGEIERRFRRRPIRNGPRTQLWSATLVDHYPDDPEGIRTLFSRHLLEPVRFRPMIQAMYDAGVRAFIQVGQGRLGGLIDDTLSTVPHLTIAANTDRRSGMDQLRRVAVALWVEGGRPDFDALESSSEDAVIGSAAGASQRIAAAGEPGELVQLDLGSPLVTLDQSVLPRPASDDPLGATSDLARWAQLDPMASELLELLTDTARTAAAALDDTAGAGEAAGRGWLDPAEEPEPVPEPLEPVKVQLRIGVDTMPFLMDHCLAPQRAGWPEISDLRPVMPATTIVRLMMDVAEKAAPGRVAVGLSDVRFDRWLPASPPTDVTVSAEPIGADALTVTFGEYARAVVRLADGYPDRNRPLWPHEGSQEEPPVLSGQELYRERWMFHGPRYQGVIGFLGHSDTHARAVLNPTSAPGSLLDAAGQILAYFARVNLPERYVIFPAAIDRIDFYGPEPPPGTPVTCLTWVPWIEKEWLHAHFQLVVDGEVWAEINGWLDRRFDVRAANDEAFRFPERETVSDRMPEGWTMASEVWSDLATRELVAGRYLGAAERAEMLRLPPRDRRHWLLERIAIKDAVRARLWAAGRGPIFPAELRVATVADGEPTVVGEHGFDLPPLRVSLARSREVAVAIARPDTGSGAGIAIEEIRDHAENTLDAALAPEESDLLTQLVSRTAEPAATWFTRIWVAKEVAAKAVGDRLGDDPRRFVVASADAGPDRLVVTAPSGGVVPVSLRTVDDPSNPEQRGYVVAWTPDQNLDQRPGEAT